jgi:hypothetical protein
MCRQSPSRGEQAADALLANLGGCDNESIDNDAMMRRETKPSNPAHRMSAMRPAKNPCAAWQPCESRK